MEICGLICLPRMLAEYHHLFEEFLHCFCLWSNLQCPLMTVFMTFFAYFPMVLLASHVNTPKPHRKAKEAFL
jgi:hypothetical protein